MTQVGWEIRPLGWVVLITLLLTLLILLTRWVRRWPDNQEPKQ